MSLNFPNPVTHSNIGGCNKFSFICANDINLLAVDYDLNKVISLFTVMGAPFFDGYATYATLRYEEKMKENASGTSFFIKISGFYPVLSPQIQSVFSRLAKMPLVVKVKDNNLITRLAGTRETPLKFTFDATSGRSPSARSGYNFQFSGHVKRPSPVID